MARHGEALTVAGEQAASGAQKRAPLWDGAVALPRAGRAG